MDCSLAAYMPTWPWSVVMWHTQRFLCDKFWLLGNMISTQIIVDINNSPGGYTVYFDLCSLTNVINCKKPGTYFDKLFMPLGKALVNNSTRHGSTVAQSSSSSVTYIRSLISLLYRTSWSHWRHQNKPLFANRSQNLIGQCGILYLINTGSRNAAADPELFTRIPSHPPLQRSENYFHVAYRSWQNSETKKLLVSACGF